MSIDIPICDPDFTRTEVAAVDAALQLPSLYGGHMVERFEEAFANSVRRAHAVAVASGGTGLQLLLRALSIGPGDEVICSAFSFKESAQAIAATGATMVFSEIDYWSGTLDVTKIEAKVTPATKAILAANTNGHPAPWGPLEALATRLGLLLLEDSTEAIGSHWQDRPVGSFGRGSVFDLSQPGPITCGQGGMIVTDDAALAARLRHMRGRGPEDRFSSQATSFPALQAGMSEISAALGLAQLSRLEEILLKRQHTERLFHKHIRSFEGIKDPFVSPDASEVHWMLYVVHLGTRFSRQSRDAIVEDLRTAGIEAHAYCHPLHLQGHWAKLGHSRGDLRMTEKVADRAVALPLHHGITEEQVAFVVKTMKEASVNVGAGAAIY
jgi:perosamine synthetase